MLLFSLQTMLNPSPALSQQSTLQTVLDRGHLVVGIRTTTPGFGFRDAQGNIDGFDIDIAREIAQGLFGDSGKIEFEVLPSGAERVPALLSGRVDMVISQFSVFTERAQVVGFTIPYCNASLSAIVKIDSEYQRNADLGGKVVTTRQGSELDELIRKAIPDAIIQSYPSMSDSLLAFRQGRAEAMFNDHAAGLFITREFPNQFRVINDPENPLDANQYSIGVRQNDQVWINYLNWALIRMNLEGRLSEIHMKWLKTDDLVPNWARLPY